MNRSCRTSPARAAHRLVDAVTTAVGLVLLAAVPASAAVSFRYEGAIELSRQPDGRLLPAAVTCGAPGRHRLPADHKLTCTVVAPDGAATTITLTFKADGDLDGWAVQ